MDIRTENDITPEVALALREKSGLYQREFWEMVGSTQSSGHWFENGKRQNGIPLALRKLILLRFVIGLDIDLSTPEKVDATRRIVQELNARLAAARAKADAKAAERKVRAAVRETKDITPL